MNINRKLLPIKLHFFFFMASMGPILPQLPVFGKDLGISPVVMGTVTGILPFTFLLTKPFFGMLVDVYRDYRKTIFMVLIAAMTLSYGVLYFIPPRPLKTLNISDLKAIKKCSGENAKCDNGTYFFKCTSDCLEDQILLWANISHQTEYKICTLTEDILFQNLSCSLVCKEDTETDNGCWYESLTFWLFVLFMSVGTIGFNVVNSISDAICFDIVENQNLYGQQRLWGSIGFGLTALIAGYLVNVFMENFNIYGPAITVMIICSIFDLLVCWKLELPVIKAPENICKEMKLILVNGRVVMFIIFTVLAGVIDSLVVYFLFWFLEDLATTTNTTNVKLIEGLIVAAETLGGEVIFFSISGRILERIGHVNCFTMCFFNYALRLGLISVVSSPWWILPIEFFMQGLTYALTYTTIVAYANEIAPPGTSATMQGIAAGMADGTGYAIGSILGGLFYKYLGGTVTFQLFASLAVICGILHSSLHKNISLQLEPRRNRDDYERIS